MLCIHCGGICDFHPSYICIPCRERIARQNEHEHLLYLLGEAYNQISDIRLRRQIEISLGIIPEETPQRPKIRVSHIVTP